jgi:hypothetical protein
MFYAFSEQIHLLYGQRCRLDPDQISFVIVSYQKSHQSSIQPAGDNQNLFFYSSTRLIMIGNLLRHRQRRGDAQIYRLFGFFHYFNI